MLSASPTMSGIIQERLGIEPVHNLRGNSILGVNPGAPSPNNVNLNAGFEGIGDDDTACGCEPPDTHGAAGPTHVVEVVNTAIRISTKVGVEVSTQELDDFFAPVGPFGGAGPGSQHAEEVEPEFAFDPLVTYDDISGRFIVAAVAPDFDAETAFLLYAVSDTSDPTDGFTEMHKIDVKEAGPNVGEDVWGDYPKVGWNADAIVFTLNMFGFTGFGYDHVSVVTIDKSTVLDVNAGTQTFTDVNRDDTHFTMAAASMHGSLTGDPMYFVEEAGYANGDALRVVKMTSVLSAMPVFTDTDIDVDDYGFPFDAVQPGGSFTTNDNRILNAEWRGDRLVASQNASGLDGFDHATWYEFDTSGGTPTLTQQQQFGSDIDTYWPAVAINAAGDIGMTYLQSSADEFVSMYVTGQDSTDPPGTMQAGELAVAGTDTYTGSRGGDYAGLSVDPSDDSFWGFNEYSGDQFWNTYVQNFEIDAAPPPPDVDYLSTAAAFNKKLKLKLKGAQVALDGVNNGSAAIDLGSHTFTFYGTTYTGNNKLFVSDNGLITFGGGITSGANSDLTASPSRASIAVAWDDWTTNATTKGKNDAVIYKFDDANNRLIIQWNAVRHAGESAKQTATFLAVLQLGTGADNGDITVHFVDMTLKGSSSQDGGSATVGVKAAGPQGDNRELNSFNTATHASESAILFHDTAIAKASAGIGASLDESVLNAIARARIARRR